MKNVSMRSQDSVQNLYPTVNQLVPCGGADNQNDCVFHINRKRALSKQFSQMVVVQDDEHVSVYQDTSGSLVSVDKKLSIITISFPKVKP